MLSIFEMDDVRNMQHSIPQGPKAIYILHVQVCKYVGNPLTSGETTIYRYTSNIPPQTYGGSTILSLERKKLCCALVCAFVKKSANYNCEDT
jgi:hypothetical protein